MDEPLDWGRISVPAGQSALTPRERQMLELVSRGHSNKEIARQIFVSENTVKYHLKNVYRKLCVRGRTQAAAVATETLPATGP